MTIDNFTKAFTDNKSGCRWQCRCGLEYYNSDGDRCWNDGELEELQASEAKDIAHPVGTINFEGIEYVLECDCWRDDAQRVMEFIDYHNIQIAKYLNLEREKKIKKNH